MLKDRSQSNYRRVTIMIDADNLTKLRDLHAKCIKKINGPFSFSKVINHLITEGQNA